MSAILNEWIKLNNDAVAICKQTNERIRSLKHRGPFVDVCGAFVQKSAETFIAVNILYANHLEEPAQALIRILFELRINFDCLLTMAHRNARNAIQRIIDSMMLEKVKQARASGFMGIPNEIQKDLEKAEKEIADRYNPEEFKQLRKHGFTGVPIEQRATMTGHEAAYNVVYRNFSRNIHSIDYLENYLKTGSLFISDQEGYIESRDVIAHYVAHFSAVGISELANNVFSLGLEKELDELGKRKLQIKALKNKKNE